MLIVVAIIILPLIGNQLIQSTLNEKIEMLSSNGVAVKTKTTDSGYFRTNMHFEFVLQDSQKYISYMNQYADGQIPSYADMMLKGMHVGMDLSYSNILFDDSVEIDIYPLTLADKTMLDLEKKDKDFYAYISNFLKIKGLLYHLNYDLSTDNFDGYIKDIDEEYTFKDKANTKLIMKKMIFSGTGSLFHPSKMDSSLEKLVFNSTANNEIMDFIASGISTSSSFKTKTTYITKANVQNIELKTKGLKSAEFYLKNLNLDLFADTESKKAKFAAKSSFKELSLNATGSDFSLSDFNYDVNIDEVDKDAFENLRALLSQAQTNLTAQLQSELSNAMFNLLSKGLVLDIKDISIGDISKDSIKADDAFSIKALLSIKADTDMLKNINTNPAKFVQNINLDAFMKISKKFFTLMNKEVPVSMIAGGFAKEIGNDFVFDIKFKDSKLNVNGKALK